MKKNNKCSKCESTKIIKVDHGCIQSREFATIGVFHSVAVRRYVCTKCGYMEEWVDVPPRFSELADKSRGEVSPDLK